MGKDTSIIWKNIETEENFFDITDLYSRLGFIDSTRLYLHCQKGLVIIIKKSLRRKIYSDLKLYNTEMGGLLLGIVFQLHYNHRESYVTIITDSILCEDCESTSVSLKLGTEVWDLARESLSNGKIIIGWFHSHPRIGAFFSFTDRYTQKCFFNLPYQVGLVIDPFRAQEKWFFGENADTANYVFNLRETYTY
jgi:hypothetical protein